MTLLILACLAYVALFAALWLRTRFVARKGRTSRIKVLPWNGHLFVQAPSDAAAVDALLRADLDLAGRGR